MFSTCPSVRPFVRLSVTKIVNTIFFKTNESIPTHIGTTGPRGNGNQH